MESLFRSIQNDIKKFELQQNKIAAAIGCKKESLTHYLQGKTKMKFMSYLLLLSNIYSCREKIKERILEFINKTDRQDDFKEALEWSIQNGATEVFNEALSKAEDEISNPYILLDKRKRRNISPLELFEESEKLYAQKHKNKDMQLMAKILSLYAQYDLKKISSINLYIALLSKEIQKIKGTYIKTALLLRSKELLVVSQLKDDNVEKAKENALSILQDKDIVFFPLIRNTAYSLMAEIYLFSDPDKSIECISKALKLDKELNYLGYTYREAALKATYDFINIHFENFDNLYLEDPAEQAHYFAKKGGTENKKRAIGLLEKMRMKNNLTPHQNYYLYLSTMNEDDKEIARKSFYKSGDIYYARLLE